MKDLSDELKVEIVREFPMIICLDRAAPHECPECDRMSIYLSGRTWREIEFEFAEDFAGSISLLSDGAYQAYLPGWLYAALNDVDGDAAAMLLINLIDHPRKELLSAAQCETVGRVSEFVARSNPYGPTDPVNRERLAELARIWPTSVGPN